MLKGVSFNVTLSEEQMDHIAALSADKIHYTFRRIEGNDKWLQNEIEELKRQLRTRDELIVKQELRMEFLNNVIERQKMIIEEEKKGKDGSN